MNSRRLNLLVVNHVILHCFAPRITEEQLGRLTKSKPLLLPKHAIANNFAFIPVQLTEPLRYDDRRLISLSDPRSNFCAIWTNTGNTFMRGVLALTSNILIWDQRPASPIALVPNEILRSFHCPLC